MYPPKQQQQPQMGGMQKPQSIGPSLGMGFGQKQQNPQGSNQSPQMGGGGMFGGYGGGGGMGGMMGRGFGGFMGGMGRGMMGGGGGPFMQMMQRFGGYPTMNHQGTDQGGWGQRPTPIFGGGYNTGVRGPMPMGGLSPSPNMQPPMPQQQGMGQAPDFQNPRMMGGNGQI